MKDIPIERIVALDLQPDDLIVIETGPLTMEQADRIRRQMKTSGISNRVLVMESGMTLQVALRDVTFAPPE